MEQLESSEVKPEDISNASVYAISMKPLGQDCIEAEKLFTQHYKNKLIDYLNDDTLKKRKTLVSKDRRMSKYSIIHRKYTINANKAETQKQMVSRTATKSAAKGKVVKSDISHVKPPFNPYQQGYYKWNTFGNKVKDVQKDYDRRSFGSTSSGGTVSVKK